MSLVVRRRLAIALSVVIATTIGAWWLSSLKTKLSGIEAPKLESSNVSDTAFLQALQNSLEQVATTTTLEELIPTSTATTTIE